MHHSTGDSSTTSAATLALNTGPLEATSEQEGASAFLAPTTPPALTIEA